MLKQNIKIGTTYIVKVSGKLTQVRITRAHDRGGWFGVNLTTGREVRIRTAARLRVEAKLPGEGRLEQIRNQRSQGLSYAEARAIVDKIEF